jgi:hypothetical protein
MERYKLDTWKVPTLTGMPEALLAFSADSETSKNPVNLVICSSVELWSEQQDFSSLIQVKKHLLFGAIGLKKWRLVIVSSQSYDF